MARSSINRIMDKSPANLTEEDIDKVLRYENEMMTKYKRSKHMTKTIVNQNSFWGAWTDGMPEPTIFDNSSDAKEEVAEMARNNPGVKAYLLKLEGVGTAVSEDMVLKGKMLEEISEDD